MYLPKWLWLPNQVGYLLTQAFFLLLSSHLAVPRGGAGTWLLSILTTPIDQCTKNPITSYPSHHLVFTHPPLPKTFFSPHLQIISPRLFFQNRLSLNFPDIPHLLTYLPTYFFVFYMTFYLNTISCLHSGRGGGVFFWKKKPPPPGRALKQLYLLTLYTFFFFSGQPASK